MGYTHYWRWHDSAKDMTEQMKEFSQDCYKLYLNLPEKVPYTSYEYKKGNWIEKTENVPVIICNRFGDEGTKPVFNDVEVGFNGCEQYAHETFLVSLYSFEHNGGFDFCKTARKPYDILVTACLIRLAYRFNEVVRVSSDGDTSDWKDGQRLCEKVFDSVGCAVPFVDEVEHY